MRAHAVGWRVEMMVIARHRLLAPCSALASARRCGPTRAGAEAVVLGPGGGAAA